MKPKAEPTGQCALNFSSRFSGGRGFHRRVAKPTDNPFIESFNGSFRDECLSINWFLSLEDAKAKIEAFREDYNSFRPHSSLCGLTPEEVVADYLKNPDFSILERY